MITLTPRQQSELDAMIGIPHRAKDPKHGITCFEFVRRALLVMGVTLPPLVYADERPDPEQTIEYYRHFEPCEARVGAIVEINQGEHAGIVVSTGHMMQCRGAVGVVREPIVKHVSIITGFYRLRESII